MNVKKADTAPALERVLKVRGSEQKKETTAPMAANPTVQTECPGLRQLSISQGLSQIRPTRHGIQITRDGQNVKTLGYA